MSPETALARDIAPLVASERPRPAARADALGPPPRHIAIIMDGNRRWARRAGLGYIDGYRAGLDAVRRVMAACHELELEALTLFAFSSENWSRPRHEVRALMGIFSSYLREEVQGLDERGVRVRFVGERDRLSRRLQRQMQDAEQRTARHARRHLAVAMNYGGQWDIAQAAAAIARRAAAGQLDPALVDIDMVASHMSLADLPPVDLCVRTAGEQRLSNFLLWQLAYAELYFTDALWPEFDADSLHRAIQSYRGRSRRFGSD